MGYSIPVFFMPIARSELPPTLKSWHTVEPLLGELYPKAAATGLRESVSRNWWHQAALEHICQVLGIPGLDFVQLEIACLCGEELAAAARALDQVLNELSDGLPYLGSKAEETAEIELLRGNWGPEGFDYYASITLRNAFAKAEPSFRVDARVDYGLEAVVGFFSFVKSLRAALGEALSQEKCLLYVQPQP
jgi:hypothetical protein